MILLWILQLALAEEICQTYSCVYGNLKSQQCSYYSDGGYYIKPCEDPYYSVCQLDYSSHKNTTCEAVEGQDPSIDVGQRCNKNSECNNYANTGCKEGVCKGIPISDYSETCKSSHYCQPGSYCKNNNCVALIESGKYGCITDFDCQNSDSCDGGFCAPYQSIPPGGSVKSCFYGENNACEYLKCYTDYFGESFCSGKDYRSKSSPIICETDEDCVSNANEYSGKTSNAKCRCGYNAKGLKYCDLVTGDDYYAKYLTALKEWRQSEGILKCNTMNRNSDICAKDWWDYEKTIKLLYYKKTVELFPEIQESDYCVEETLLKEYFDLRHRFEHL